MDLVKSYDFFKPEMCRERIHIIGCGSVGSTLAENLARFGLTKITLYDFDKVESKNIANQMFRQKDIGKLKVEAVAEMLEEINPDIKYDLKLVEKGYTGQKLAGYVFLCVDDIELRKQIAVSNENNLQIKAMFDFRIGLTEAQHYAADWVNKNMVRNFISTMNFTNEEAKAETPMSACNVVLSVCPTVRVIVALGVSNFVNFVKGEPLRQMIMTDAFRHTVNAL